MSKLDSEGSQPQQFMMGSIVGMSLQMAVVVLLPLIAGNWLDNQFKTLPFLTLAGLILAMAGMVVVVRRSLRDLNEYMNQTKPTEDQENTSTK